MHRNEQHGISTSIVIVVFIAIAVVGLGYFAFSRGEGKGVESRVPAYSGAVEIENKSVLSQIQTTLEEYYGITVEVKAYGVSNGDFNLIASWYRSKMEELGWVKENEISKESFSNNKVGLLYRKDDEGAIIDIIEQMEGELSPWLMIFSGEWENIRTLWNIQTLWIPSQTRTLSSDVDIEVIDVSLVKTDGTGIASATVKNTGTRRIDNVIITIYGPDSNIGLTISNLGTGQTKSTEETSIPDWVVAGDTYPVQIVASAGDESVTKTMTVNCKS